MEMVHTHTHTFSLSHNTHTCKDRTHIFNFRGKQSFEGLAAFRNIKIPLTGIVVSGQFKMRKEEQKEREI